MDSSRTRRCAGKAVLGAVLVLVALALALGGNYVRNVKKEEQQQKAARPYAQYALEDLQALADGYKAEIAKAESRLGGGRVATRERYHHGDQVREFERVQAQAHRNRDRAVEVAQLRADLAKVEQEIGQRQSAGSGLQVHLSRMFGI